MLTLDEIDAAITTTKRLGGKVPRVLYKQQRTLELYAQWQRKAKLAATKLRIYRARIKRYERAAQRMR